jgi:acyl-CoA dehydrogenase
MLGFTLTEEQKELRQKARDFALSEVLPIAWEYDEKDEIPMELIKKARDYGIMNTDIPKEYGGEGLGLVEGALLTEEIAAACPGIATSVFDNSLGMEPLLLSDKEEIKKKYFSEVLTNEKMICFATSEPVMGSDVAGMKCKAEPDGDDYILNGTKYWITNGGVADYMTVFATVDPSKKHGGICAFVVEREWEGVTVGKPIPKLGQRTSNTVGLHFENVRVPAANVLAGPGEGFALAMKTFSRTRPIIGAFAVGAARSALEYALEYVKKRRAFGATLNSFQMVQAKIAEMYQKVETSRLLVWKAAWEADNGMDPTISASISKFYATEAALEVVSDALQLLGGYGYTRMFPLEKLYRDVRLLMIYEGTSEVQRIIVAGHALGSYEPVMPSMDDLPVTGEPAEGKKAWRCRVCGHVHYGDEPPEKCPYCFMPSGAFKELA